MAPLPKYSASEADDRSFLKGKVALITGPTNGLGASCVDKLCALGDNKPAKVLLVARNPTLAAERKAQLEGAGIAAAVHICDVSKPAEVLAVARKVVADEPALHVAMLNAGVWDVSATKQMTKDGFELHYATNFLQMCLFAEELMPLLEKSAPARVCAMGSFTGYSLSKGVLDFSEFGNDKGQVGTMGMMPKGLKVYSQSKLAQHMWCKEKAAKMPAGVTLNVCCPGTAPSNIPAWKGMSDAMGCMWPAMKWMMGARSTDDGCETMMHLAGAASMAGVTGKHLDWGFQQNRLDKYKPADLDFYPTQRNAVGPSIKDAALRGRLFDETAETMAKLRAAPAY